MKNRKAKRIRGILLGISAGILFFVWVQTEGIHFMEKFSEENVDVECKSVLWWITKSDRVKREDSKPLDSLQPGDILLSLSTHTLGWRHGHAALVLDENAVLECGLIGKNSNIADIDQWQEYSNHVVLRVKGVSEEEQKAVVAFAKNELYGVPYRLTAGLFGEKEMNLEDDDFGLHCAYLVWYAWYHMGYDLDSNGGRLVTVRNILNSDKTEVVQVYGLDLK